jgi:hypothetical protein
VRLLFLSVLLLAACDRRAGADCRTPSDATIAGADVTRIVASPSEGGVRVRGFSGSATAGAAIVVTAGGAAAQTTADAQGRFDLEISADAENVDLAIDGRHALFAASDLAAREACAESETAPVGTVPNDVAIGTCGALVVSSADARVDPVHVRTTAADPSGAAFYPPGADRVGTTPWSVALFDDGTRAAVTLFGTHQVSLFDDCTGAIASTVRPDVVVDVDPPRDLRAPIDADGDGTPESHVTRMQLRAPEGVAVVGERVLVGFTNALELAEGPGRPGSFGPPVLAAFDVVDGVLAFAAQVTLPFDNPQAIVLDEQGRPWVSCSGILEDDADGIVRAATPGGIVRVDPTTLAVQASIPFGDFAPGTPAVCGDRVAVGSLVRPLVGFAAAGQDIVRTPVEGDLIDSLFEAAPMGGGLAMITQFSTDQLHVVDVVTGELHPFPFTTPIGVGPGGPGKRGAQSVAARGLDAVVVLGLSAELQPLDLRQVLGP